VGLALTVICLVVLCLWTGVFRYVAIISWIGVSWHYHRLSYFSFSGACRLSASSHLTRVFPVSQGFVPGYTGISRDKSVYPATLRVHEMTEDNSSPIEGIPIEYSRSDPSISRRRKHK
jgi:hypothetical protein